jgi:hypothetical protein
MVCEFDTKTSHAPLVCRAGTFNAKNCALQGKIPSELAYCTKLSSLYFHRNYLTGTLPSELGNLSKLQDLYVVDNLQLSGTVPDEFANLTSLLNLDISGTGITGTIPPEMCREGGLNVPNIAVTRGTFLDCSCCSSNLINRRGRWMN